MADPEINVAYLDKLLVVGESHTVDMKETWPDLSAKSGKAHLAKDVLAFANSMDLGEVANIVFGVQDRKRGGAVVGVSEPPSAEQVSQILAAYTTPPPRVFVRDLPHSGTTLSVLTIVGTAARPHHAVRTFAGVLDPSHVYVRRDRTNGVATSQEVEAMIRKRIGRGGRDIDQAPLKVGFIGVGHAGGSRILVIRVTNTTESPVADVDVLVDFQHIGLPSLTSRHHPLNTITIAPSATHEIEMPLSQMSFALRSIDMVPRPSIRVDSIAMASHHHGDGWVNAILRVRYRDTDGFLHELVKEMALDV